LTLEPSTNRTLAILISGRGSNLQAIVQAIADGRLDARIAVVISNRADAAGLQRAREAGLETLWVSHRDFATREDYDRRLVEELRARNVGLVCLAGFMRLLTASFVERWRDRLINIHPSLLPSYRGLDTHARAIADGVRFAGCTVHFVRAEMDAGPIIVQAAVPVRSDDDADRLAARVLEAEHRCYKLALRLIATGRVRVDGERVIVDGAAAPPAILLNPDDGRR